MTTLELDGRTYEIRRTAMPSWDDYDVIHGERWLGRARVFAIADEDGRRRYVIEGNVEAVVHAAIHADLIVVTRLPSK